MKPEVYCLRSTERAATRTAFGHIWIIDFKSSAHQTLYVVYICTFQVFLAVAVYKHLYSIFLKYNVCLFFHEGKNLFCCLWRNGEQFCGLCITHCDSCSSFKL